MFEYKKGMELAAIQRLSSMIYIFESIMVLVVVLVARQSILVEEFTVENVKQA